MSFSPVLVPYVPQWKPAPDDGEDDWEDESDDGEDDGPPPPAFPDNPPPLSPIWWPTEPENEPTTYSTPRNPKKGV